MSISDPIADMLTIIRNGIQAEKEFVNVKSSNMKIEIVKILKDNKYVSNFKIIRDNKQNIIRVFLLYKNGKSVITHISRISKPSLRLYRKNKNIKKVLNGFGLGIYSTPKGIITDLKAKELNVGGEFICQVW
jgi:small subunit ribosomal protein S8